MDLGSGVARQYRVMVEYTYADGIMRGQGSQQGVRPRDPAVDGLPGVRSPFVRQSSNALAAVAAAGLENIDDQITAQNK